MPTSLISVDPVSNIIAIKDILYATSVSVVLTFLLIAVLVFSKYNLAVNHGYLLSTIKSSAKRIGKTEDVLLRVSGGALLFAFAVIAPTFFQLAPCNSIQCEAGQMLLGQRSSAYGIIVAATIVTSVAIYGMTRLLVLLAVSLCYKP